MAKFKRVLQPLFLIAAFLVVAQVGSAVSAMCVYNNADINIEVAFDCGVFCENDWNTQPNNVYCRASESGTLGTGFRCCFNGLNYPTVVIDVDAHGWIEMTQPSSTEIDVCAYHQDGSSAGCQSFDPTL